MVDFVEDRFKYFERFEKFRSYLTTQYLVHKNLLRVFFYNATLENVDEEDEDPCRIVVINTFMMGVPIRVTLGVVVETFNMPDKGLDFEHEGFSLSMMILHDNALDLPFH